LLSLDTDGLDNIGRQQNGTGQDERRQKRERVRPLRSSALSRERARPIHRMYCAPPAV
jgi:hypothetical protein